MQFNRVKSIHVRI